MDLRGKLRIESLDDELYVVGQGCMIRVETYEDGQIYINSCNKHFKGLKIDEQRQIPT